MDKVKNLRPTILCIGGNDSAGMAGLTMDSRYASALGVHALTVVTANTSQNSNEFVALNACSIEVLNSQLKAFSEQDFSAIKIGLLPNREQLDALVDYLTPLDCPVIFDPVIGTSAGPRLWDEEMLTAVKARLLPLVTVITPNLPEFRALVGEQTMAEEGAKVLLDAGCDSVVVSGGHAKINTAQDYFADGKREFWLTSPMQPTINSRGSGCALATGIASALALGHALYDAVVIAKMAINQGLRNSYTTGNHRGPLNPGGFPEQQTDLPTLTATAVFEELPPFPDCGDTNLDLYPVVDTTAWLERLLPLGVTTAQLRIKNLEGEALEAEIKAAIALGKTHNCRLFINDYWELAIKHKAYGVHLGQEDLDTANIAAIHRAGLRLGTSTHCHYEVARAHSYKPSYIAIGPVYPTQTKAMPWIPHGVEGFSYWQKTLQYPLVAIGGIKQAQTPGLISAGASGIAMITAITEADNPEASAREFMELIGNAR